MVLVDWRPNCGWLDAELAVDPQESLNKAGPKGKEKDTKAILDLVSLKALRLSHLRIDAVRDIVAFHDRCLAANPAHYFAIGETTLINKLSNKLCLLGRLPFLNSGHVPKAEKGINLLPV